MGVTILSVHKTVTNNLNNLLPGLYGVKWSNWLYIATYIIHTAWVGMYY